MFRERPANPIVQRNTKDRTGTAGILRRAYADIRRRYAALQAELVARFDQIPVYAINDLAGPAVRYGLTPEQLGGIAEDLQAALDRWLLQGRTVETVFWWDAYSVEASQLGTAQSVANLTNLSTVYAAARSLEQVIYSEPYRTRLTIAKFRNYEHWTSLGAEARGKLAQVIGRAVVDGINPRAARKLIVEALDVSKGRALLYAQTDITNTLREARLAESEASEVELGVFTGLLWTSAFLPTTRPWHASRSGHAYTREEVKAFYAQGGNRYRCHCSITECLLDADKKPILSKKLQSTMANERKTWQSAHVEPKS